MAAAGGIGQGDWTDAIEMDNAQVAVAGYRPDWWPANTFLLIRRVRLAPEQVSADPRSRPTPRLWGLDYSICSGWWRLAG